MTVAVDNTFMDSIFPELAPTAPAVITALNPMAATFANPQFFGDSAQLAMALVIAHWLTLGSWSGGGAVIQDKIGDLMRAQAALPVDTSMRMTSYGLRFLSLARIKQLPSMFVGGVSTTPPSVGGWVPTWPSNQDDTDI